MTVTYRNIDLGNGAVRHIVTIVGEECEPNTQSAYVQYMAFLRYLADNYNLLKCGGSLPSKITITHGGFSWMAIAEADVSG